MYQKLVDIYLNTKGDNILYLVQNIKFWIFNGKYIDIVYNVSSRSCPLFLNACKDKSAWADVSQVEYIAPHLSRDGQYMQDNKQSISFSKKYLD